MEWESLIAGSNESALSGYLGWAGDTGQDPDWRAVGEQDAAMPYEPPRVLVIGKVQDLTGGSASSGKKDANSQYYW
jgi:hypothetical protein